ncbi:MAG TPA: hypothetical protein VGL63_15230 [Streptosporangiaceae bacterium]
MRRTAAAASILVLALAGGSTGAGAAASRAGTAVPAGFKAAAITWLSPGHGWVLGSVPCGRRACADAIVSGDGGMTWQQAGRLPALVASVDTPADTGAAGIRFATRAIGWAFGPELFRTGDGGRSWLWQAIPGGGKQVLALASSAAGTYIVVSPCKQYAPACPGRTLSLWRADPAAGTSWKRIPLS